MEMEFLTILRVIWHWRSLILSIILVAAAAFVIRTRVLAPEYETTVKLQITTPQIEDVNLYEAYRYVEVRDQVTVARNNLTEVLKSNEIYEQTLTTLDIEIEDDIYEVEIEQVRDSDFLLVTFKTGNKDLAAEIASIHVDSAVKYFGVLRAKPAKAIRDLIYEQLLLTELEFRTAEESFTNFKTHNSILSLEEQITSSQLLIQELNIAQDIELYSPEELPISGIVPVLEQEPVPIEDLIAKREAELENLISLQPTYLLLEEEASQAREKFQHIKEKYSEAELKVTEIEAANFIQVALSAGVPEIPESSILTSLILPLIGTMGFAVMIAFLFEYLLGISERRTEASLEVQPEVSVVETTT